MTIRYVTAREFTCDACGRRIVVCDAASPRPAGWSSDGEGGHLCPGDREAS
jgi:hypothetical protein